MARLGAGLSVLSLLSFGVGACSDSLPPSGSPAPDTPTTSATSSAAIGVPADPTVLVEAGLDNGEISLTQGGTARVEVSTSTDDGGAVQVDEGADAEGGRPSLRLPTFVPDDAAPYPRAVVTVTNAGSTDQLDPGDGTLTFGVDFNVDAVSTGRDDDNGNNLIQRGLSSDPALYKLEIDANMRPTCTVRGTEGTVIARSSTTALPGEWYRVRCVRAGDEVRIDVGRVLPDGSAVPVAAETPGPTGVVTMGDPTIPVSVGGKVAHNGAVINSAGDQFNGLLRDPYVSIDR